MAHAEIDSRPDQPDTRPRIFTIGHSTRTFEDFIEILQAHGVRAVADVRSIPKSRRYPHFADDFLASHLPEAGIAYLPFKQLGGRRRPRADSPNTAWRNASFRGYADFLQTDAFREGLEQLLAAARIRPTATMCAEAVPWRCHRSLISDALVVRGWEVLDIFDKAKTAVHKLTGFARVNGTQILYPAEDAERPREPGDQSLE
jgi:uncharacterized protein (DUF488 family)